MKRGQKMIVHDAVEADAEAAFEVIRRPDYPRLGWLFELGDLPRAHCGADVEVFRDGLVEGCWAGAFSEFNFADCLGFAGSGVVRRVGAWLFCPAFHTCDAVYSMVYRGRHYASNSLLLLFEHTALTPDLGVEYTRAIVTLTNGPDRAATIIWRGADVILYRVLCHNFTLEDGDVRRHRKEESRSFPDYASYARCLKDTVAACAHNAADPARRRRTYRLLTNCSAGYDSNTAAALAAAAGCRLAITVCDARGGADDSGRPVAEALGLECAERGRAGPDGTGGAEAEFLAVGTGGGDSPMAVFEDLLAGGLLLTGHFGDSVWERTTKPKPRPDFQRASPSGASLANFRLRVGFLHLPVPFIGARRHADIYAISNSEEMRPWSLGGSYDRPICRRILEEAGVPRELVGRNSKQAVATWHSWSPSHLSPAVRESFEKFLRERGILYWHMRAKLTAFHVGALVFRALRKTPKLVPVLEQPLGGPRDRLDPLFRASENSLYANLLFIWALLRILGVRAAVRDNDALSLQGGKSARVPNYDGAHGEAPIIADDLRRTDF
jgi:hypothetical protein